MTVATRPSDYIWSLVCGLPEPSRSNKPRFMLRAYVDDSHMGQPPVYVLGGWAAPAKLWGPFSDQWLDVLWMRPRIDYFKFSEAIALSGEFQGFSEASRNEKVRLLLRVIEGHCKGDEMFGLAAIVPADIYVAAFGRDRGVMKTPFFIAAYSLVQMLAK